MSVRARGGWAGGLIVAACSMVSAAPQDAIDAAFGMQAEGATLTQVRQALVEHAGDDAVDFAIGAVDFLLAGEQLIQQLHRKGFMMPAAPIRGMVGPEAQLLSWFVTEQPEPVTYAEIEAALSGFVANLSKADASLSRVDGDFKCVLNVSNIRFDVDSDGIASSQEGMRTLFDALPPRYVLNADAGRYEPLPLVPGDLVIAFDRGDASWLRGYSHLLMAVGEFLLAHDAQDLFDRTGHVFFPEAQIKYDFLKNSTYFLEFVSGERTPTAFDLTDLLAFVGNIEFEVDEPERMARSLEHLRQTVRHGREMWTHYDRERDNDREWIPNPHQTAAFSQVKVDQDMHDAWILFLDECDGILSGRKVLRFWRSDGKRGIDVPRVFLEPREFNLLYWIQGSAAAPYLREGEFTSEGTWQRLVEVFDDRVFRFSFWFN